MNCRKPQSELNVRGKAYLKALVDRAAEIEAAKASVAAKFEKAQDGVTRNKPGRPQS